MKTYNVVIVGCGASGSMAACFCKEKSLAIIDASLKPAKKILATGNGRCNLTNKNINSSYFNQNIDKFLNKFSVDETLKVFENLGLETYFDEEGRCYPISNSAKSVVDVLSRVVEQKADIYLGETVENIVVENNQLKHGFVIYTNKDCYYCKKLVVACGGNSLLNCIKNIGIEVKKCYPSLVSLNASKIKDLAGLKVSNVLVSIKSKDGTVKSEIGEVLFKDGGISGIVIFNLSTLLARRGDYRGEVTIDLLPEVSHEELISKLTKRKSLNVLVDKFFVGFFQNALANEIFKKAKINTNVNCANLNNAQIKILANTIKSLKFDVEGASNNNQVYSGGVLLRALDDNLMSKNVPNLYFCGEVCDVDGVCGGYNLQWAWTSGKIVGENL